MKRRVVITGLGALTALGEGAEALWRGALDGRSGIGEVRWGAPGAEAWIFRGAEIRGFEPEKYVTQRKALKVMARDIQLGVAAASLAADDASARQLAGRRDRYGVIVGSGVLNHELDELAFSVLRSLGPDGRLDLSKFGQEGLSALFPLWLLKYLPNMPACHISILFDLQGPNNTLTTGASSGLEAVCEAFRIIRRGSADLVFAGAAESKLNPLGLAQYGVLGALGNGNSPAGRPFDPESHGIIPGEGAGFLVLEELEHALARGARIWAEIAGYGVSSPRGRETALRAALADAGAKASEVDYLQAAGLGIADEDAAEAAAIDSVFSDQSRGLAVSASKFVTGFTGFSSGPLDLILSALAVARQEVPPVPGAPMTNGYHRFHLVTGRPVRKRIRYAVTSASGFGAPSACVVTKPFNGGK